MNNIFTIKSALLMACCIVCMSSKSKAQTFDGQGGPNVTNTANIGSTPDQSSTSDLDVQTSPKFVRSQFSLNGTVYSGLPYIQDDNPAAFTQTFIKANINRYLRDYPSFVLFRNFYLEGYFSTNAGTLPTYYDTAKKISLVNRLDLFQHAYARINMHENIFYVHPYSKSLWKTYFYVDAMESFMRTNVSDSFSNGSYSVNSWLLGGNVSLFMVNKKAIIPITIRLSGDLFWINALTNSVNTDLAFQNANMRDAINPINKNKSMTANPYPYYNLDAEIQFQISKKTENKPENLLFLHLGYVSNFVSSTANNYYNSYLSAQIGVSIDIIGSIKNYTDK